MNLYRCLPWNPAARHDGPDGPLWIARQYQGGGRHDSPDLYGCLYVSERPVAAVVELIAPFRNHRLAPSLLRQRGFQLALASLALPRDAQLIDLDDPAVLDRTRLRPSHVATRHREVTQPQARALYTGNPAASGLRWWSTFEASWINVTLFDRAIPQLRVQDVRTLAVGDPAVAEAVQALGMSS